MNSTPSPLAAVERGGVGRHGHGDHADPGVGLTEGFDTGGVDVIAVALADRFGGEVATQAASSAICSTKVMESLRAL